MLSEIKSVLWGFPTVAVIIGAGIYFTFKSRFFQLRSLGKVFKDTFGEMKKSSSGGISAFSAMATSLGGTVGIGSITGVGVSIAVGGYGSIFWMWVTGFFCCMLKYAEISEAVRYKVRDGCICAGGAMYALKENGKKIASAAFAFSCIFASFGTGNITQASSVASVLKDSGMDGSAVGVFLAGMVFLAVFGGRKRIAKISSVIVPAASIIYLGLITYILITHFGKIPYAFEKIFFSAFGIRQAGGAVAGVTVSLAIRTGVTRSIFSSEAGMGSSPIVHASGESSSPETQAEWGIIEMIADIFVFSTLTSLALVIYDTSDITKVFANSFGLLGDVLLPILITVFGFASIISWCFYAESCISFLTVHKNTAFTVYRIFASFAAYIGSVMPVNAVWDIADILNCFMLIPNMYLITSKRKEICLCFGKPKK